MYLNDWTDKRAVIKDIQDCTCINRIYPKCRSEDNIAFMSNFTRFNFDRSFSLNYKRTVIYVYMYRRRLFSEKEIYIFLIFITKDIRILKPQ